MPLETNAIGYVPDSLRAQESDRERESRREKKQMNSNDVARELKTKVLPHIHEKMNTAPIKAEKKVKLTTEINQFIHEAALNSGQGSLDAFNARNFDKDDNEGLSEHEFHNFEKSLNNAIQNIISLQDFDKFVNVQKDIASDIHTFSAKKGLEALTGGRSVTDLLADKGGTDAFMKVVEFCGLDLSEIGSGPEAREKLLNAKLDNGTKIFGAGLMYSILHEAPQMMEDILLLLADILTIGASSGVLMTQYAWYRLRAGSNPEYNMKLQAMTEAHPAIGLLHLLSSEQGLDAAKHIVGKIGSPTDWTAQGVVQTITSILGMLAGGAGAVRLGAKFAGTAAREGGVVARAAGAVERGAGKVQKGLEKADRFANAPANVVVEGVAKAVKGSVQAEEVLAKSEHVTAQAANDNHAQQVETRMVANGGYVETPAASSGRRQTSNAMEHGAGYAESMGNYQKGQHVIIGYRGNEPIIAEISHFSDGQAYFYAIKGEPEKKSIIRKDTLSSNELDELNRGRTQPRNEAHPNNDRGQERDSTKEQSTKLPKISSLESPRTLRHETAHLSIPDAASVDIGNTRLFLSNTKDQGLALFVTSETRMIPLSEGTRITIGRDLANDVVLKNSGARDVTIEVRGGRLIITDDSLRGTKLTPINGEYKDPSGVFEKMREFFHSTQTSKPREITPQRETTIQEVPRREPSVQREILSPVRETPWGNPDSPAPVRRVEQSMPPERVPRSGEVVNIGDIHGNVEIMRENLKALGLIDESGHWRGRDTRLVFHGDILGDRGTSSLQAFREINALRREARAAGGDITILAGNHEDFALSYLTGRKTADGSNWASFGDQARGVLEFAREYINPNIRSFDDLLRSGTNGPEVLRLMRNHPEGRRMLEDMCQMKLVEHIDDTLFTHTDLTSNMARMIQEMGVDAINQVYQEGLRAILLDGLSPKDSYQRIIETFLHTENRHYLTEAEAIALRQRGINRSMHGHSDKGNGVTVIGGIEIRSVDHSAGKGGGNMDRRSIGRIEKDGTVTTGWDAHYTESTSYLRAPNQTSATPSIIEQAQQWWKNITERRPQLNGENTVRNISTNENTAVHLLQDPHLAIVQRRELIQQLPHRTSEERQFIRSEIQRLRSIVDQARYTTVEIISNVKQSLDFCYNRGIPSTDFFRTLQGERAIALIDQLPYDIRDVVHERWNNLLTELQKQSNIRALRTDPATLVERYFGFRPTGKVEVDIQSLSTNFKFFDSNDFSATNVWSNLGFLKPTKIGTTTGVNVPQAQRTNISPTEILQHESQHIEFKTIKNTVMPRDKLSDNEVLQISTLPTQSAQSFVNNLLKPQIKLSLENVVKDEILAFMKTPSLSKQEVLSRLLELYDKTKTLRTRIEEVVNTRTDHASLLPLIQNLDNKYRTVVEHMIEVCYAQGIEQITNLTVTPHSEWYRFSKGKYNRADFSI